jgi:hypothetical protein
MWAILAGADGVEVVASTGSSVRLGAVLDGFDAQASVAVRCAGPESPSTSVNSIRMEQLRYLVHTGQWTLVVFKPFWRSARVVLWPCLNYADGLRVRNCKKSGGVLREGPPVKTPGLTSSAGTIRRRHFALDRHRQGVTNRINMGLARHQWRGGDSMNHYIVLAVILLVAAIAFGSMLYTGTHKRH